MKQKHYNFQHHSMHQKTPLNISHISMYHCQSTLNNFLKGHSYPKMIFTFQGNGTISIDKVRFPLSKNDLIIVNQGNFESIIETKSESMDFVTIGFDNIHFLFTSDRTNPSFEHFSITDQKYLSFLQNIIQEINQMSPHYQNSCDYYINLLFIYLQREFEVNYNMISHEKSNKDCELIRNYIDEHFSENLTLDILAEISKLNKYYLAHSFTNTYGCSPINYLNEKKIDESKVLLEKTNYSIAQIAELVGFSSQSYFSQSFKKHTYMTPNEFRHSTRKH